MSQARDVFDMSASDSFKTPSVPMFLTALSENQINNKSGVTFEIQELHLVISQLLQRKFVGHNEFN
jgi:hypothetical protein